MTKPFFEDDYAVIEFDDTIPCVKVTLRGVPKGSDHYQLVQAKRLELMAQEIRNYPKLHMLTDSSSAGPVLDEDIMHFRDQVMPAMEKAGVRYLAIVVPTNKFTQLTIREMTQEADIMKVRYFETLRDAKQWLRRMTVL
ncbi:hypothetical protein WBG78_13395 [Chryseolinea sp. T2]|uniref:hypothetical protein n=1 Tax=Chryseolinea sp. T2 TaxID=3129255 RepID=UPI003077672A